MKYVFIEKHQAEFSIKAMCRVLQVARSGWYIWHQRRHQINQRQQFCLVCDNVGSVALRRRQITCCFFAMLPDYAADAKSLQTSALSC